MKINIPWILQMKLKHAILIVFFLLTLFGFSWIYFMIGVIDEDIESSQHTENEQSIPVHADFEIDEFHNSIHGGDGVDRLVQLDDGDYHDFVVDRLVSPIINALPHVVAQQLPIILWWTPFSGEHGRIKRCWSGDCFFTQDQSFYNHTLTKAFLFYGTDFNISHLPLPRKAHHEWGLFHEESPKNEPMYLYDETFEFFNHTATFRQKSSYPISTQYIVSHKYLLNPPTYTVHEKNIMKVESELASVVYIQSGCNPPSDRDAYINELMKYIKVDSYGKCLHNKDLPKKYQNAMTMFDKGFINILRKYKFIISFENGICNDYMTEKLFRTLYVGAIPIYKGAPNIREWLPNNHSAIIVDDFNSPKELAEYIRFVDDHPEEYEKYMEYKETGITNILLNDTLNRRQWGVDTVYVMSFVVGFECHVCDQIHKNKKLVSSGKSPTEHRASADHYGCPVPTRYDLPTPSEYEDWERNVWRWEYERAAEKVNKLKKLMLESN